MKEDGYNKKGLCKLCGHGRTSGGDDFCIANLPGVLYACCGHGVKNGYIKFEDGRRLKFKPVEMGLVKPKTSIVVENPVPVFQNGEQNTVLFYKKGKIKTETVTMSDVQSVNGRPIEKRIPNRRGR